MWIFLVSHFTLNSNTMRLNLKQTRTQLKLLHHLIRRLWEEARPLEKTSRRSDAVCQPIHASVAEVETSTCWIRKGSNAWKADVLPVWDTWEMYRLMMQKHVKNRLIQNGLRTWSFSFLWHTLRIRSHVSEPFPSPMDVGQWYRYAARCRSDKFYTDATCLDAEMNLLSVVFGRPASKRQKPYVIFAP